MLCFIIHSQQDIHVVLDSTQGGWSRWTIDSNTKIVREQSWKHSTSLKSIERIILMRITRKPHRNRNKALIFSPYSHFEDIDIMKYQFISIIWKFNDSRFLWIQTFFRYEVDFTVWCHSDKAKMDRALFPCRLPYKIVDNMRRHL